MSGHGRRIFVRLVALAVAVGIALPGQGTALASPQPARPAPAFMSATDAVGLISADTTWTLADSPYHVTGQIVVQPGVTLTVEPGVEVSFAAGTELVVRGSLVAVGTAEAPISFLGDSGASGAWLGLEFIGGGDVVASGLLRHVSITGAGGEGGRIAQVYAYLASLDVADTTVRDGAGDGVVAETSALRLESTAVTGNHGRAVVLAGLSNAAPSAQPSLADLSIQGNGTDAIVIQSHGAIDVDATWPYLGVPYMVEGQVIVEPDVALTIEPGVDVMFAAAGELWVRGTLLALGTSEAPIRLRGEVEQPGTWPGLSFIGGTTAAVGRLEHVELTDTGLSSHAAILVSNGILTFTDGLIADAAADGISVTDTVFGVTRVEGSQLVRIAGDGVANDGRAPVLAPSNWWGAPGGPTLSDACAGTTGTRIRGLVRYLPWQHGEGELVDPLRTSGVPTLMAVPQRWYAPADGLSRIWVDITLVDDQGRPLGGQAVGLHSSIGDVTDGGTTDAAGHTLAYVVSGVAGDATIWPYVVGAGACDTVDASETTVTFTDAPDSLIAGTQAPYMSTGITVTPQPIVRGVETTITATLTNPNDVPIVVEVEFGWADSGIGLAFGPLGQLQQKEIPAGGTVSFSVTWTPVVSGHYCVEVRYRIVSGAAEGPLARPVAAVDWPSSDDLLAFAGAGTGRGSLNLNVFGGTAGSGGGGGGSRCKSGSSKCPLEKAQNAGEAMGDYGSIGTGETFLPSIAVMLGIHWAFSKTAEIDRNLGGDPPRQDYTVVATPQVRTVDVGERPADMSEARWQAANALLSALGNFNAIGDAAVIALDRYGGAAAAQDLTWSSVQASSLIELRAQLSPTATAVADAIKAYRDVLVAEGLGGTPMTIAEAEAAIAAFNRNGISDAELKIAHDLGFDDDAIEQVRQARAALTPDQLTRPFQEVLLDAESAFRKLGPYLVSEVNFPTDSGPTAAGPGFAEGGPANLARIYDQSSTIKVANPLDAPATIELRVRPISLPPGWPVVVTPSTLTLEPGEVATVTVTITPSGPAQQGTIVEAAVEGFAGDELLGGVVIGLVVPRHVDVSGVTPTPETGASSALVVAVALAAGLIVIAVVVIGGLAWRRRRAHP